MLKCNKCGVRVNGAPPYCPLCQGDLHGEPEPEKQIFPALGIGKDANAPIRWMVAILLTLAVAALAINAIFPQSGSWSPVAINLFLDIGICAYFVIKNRKNLVKMIFLEAILLSVLANVWDNYTGYTRWANTYAIPTVLSLAIVSTVLIARVQKLRISDYLFYFLFSGIVGIFTVRCMTTNELIVTYPTMICFALSILAIALTLLFEHRLIFGEIRRRLHL